MFWDSYVLVFILFRKSVLAIHRPTKKLIYIVTGFILDDFVLLFLFLFYNFYTIFLLCCLFIIALKRKRFFVLHILYVHSLTIKCEREFHFVGQARIIKSSRIFVFNVFLKATTHPLRISGLQEAIFQKSASFLYFWKQSKRHKCSGRTTIDLVLLQIFFFEPLKMLIVFYT